MPTNYWEVIRSHWVNGEQLEAKQLLYQSSKLKMCRIVRQAITAFMLSLPQGTARSGDLTDLNEILRSIEGLSPDE